MPVKEAIRIINSICCAGRKKAKAINNLTSPPPKLSGSNLSKVKNKRNNKLGTKNNCQENS